MNIIIESSESGGEIKPADWSGPGFPTELNNPGWPESLAPTGDCLAANGDENSAEIFSPTPGTSVLPNSRTRTVENQKVKLTLPGAAQTDLGQSERDDCLAANEGVFSLPSTSSPLPTGGVKRKLSESPQVSLPFAVLRIHAILGIRILLFFAIELQDASKKLIFYTIFSAFYFLKLHLHHFSKIKSQKESQNSRNQGVSYYFCMMMEGSGSGSRAESGSGSIPLSCGTRS
jgi:hypothetical protein